MNLSETVEEYLLLIDELPDEPDETVLITGFINETKAMADFELPLAPMIAVLKHRKPVIASYLEMIGSKDFKQLLRSGMTLELALAELGFAADYFDKPTK